MSYIQEHVNEYFEKTHAGWLGKVIGIRLGSAFEGWTYEMIKGTHGYIDRYVKPYEDYAADDDSNGPLFFIRSLIDFREKGKDITPEDMGETWLNYVCNGHGFFWWGGYGVSTEDTAYQNLRNDILPPLSGSIRKNGKTIAEQIGGQIFIDPWGLVKPDDPVGAAELAARMICVSHDGEGLLGGKFVVACISAAYTAKSVDEIIDRAMVVLPEDSHYRHIINVVRDFYRNDPDKDWEACYRFIRANYGYDRYPGNCHIIPNACIMILALMYGEGDYFKTLCICNSCGWDTDCNSGNLGSIMGVFCGIDNIPQKLVDPIKDIVLASSSIGYLNINTISETAEMFIRLGYQLEGLPVPDWKRKETSHKKFWHFEFEKSTSGLRCDGPILYEPVHDEDGHRRLAVSGRGRVFMKTYYRPSDLADSRYDPSFSPIIYPGERFGFNFRNVSGVPSKVRLWYRDEHDERIYHSSVAVIDGGDIQNVELSVPAGDGLIDRIGFELEERGSVEIDSFYVDGKVDYKVDFSKEVIEKYLWRPGRRHWEQRQFSYSEGSWELIGDTLAGNSARDAEIMTGEYGLKDYDLWVEMTPELGSDIYTSFRLQGLARYYMFGFSEEGRIVFRKKHRNTFTTIAEGNYPWKHGESYEVHIAVEGDTFTAYINDEEVLSVQDPSYGSGIYGFTLLDGSRCSYRNLMVRER